MVMIKTIRLDPPLSFAPNTTHTDIMKNFLPESAAARLIGIDRTTLRKYRNIGYFSVSKFPGLVLYPTHELKDFKRHYENRATRKVIKNSAVPVYLSV